MKQRFLFLAAFFALLLPAENLLPKTMNWESWRCWVHPEFRVETPRKEYFRNNALCLNIPLQKAEWSRVLLYKLVPLDEGQDYRLTFTVETGRAAELIVAAGIRQKPHYPNFQSKKLTIHPGKLQYDWSFRFVRKPGYPADAPSALSFYLGNFIDTTVTVSNVKLARVEPSPLPADRWTAFVNASVYREAPRTIPDKWFYSANGREETEIHPIQVTAVNGKINCLPLMPKHEPRSCILLMTEIDSDRDRTVRLGFAADWYFTFYCNGKEFYSTSRLKKAGNGTRRFSPDNHPVDFELKKGKNTLAIKVFPGSESWFLQYGATKQAPRHQAWQNLAECYLPTVTLKDGNGWNRAALGKLVVQPGTALDFSASVPAPAGKFGRLILDAEGRPVFENAPDTPVRFFGCNFPFRGLYPYATNKRWDGVHLKDRPAMNRDEFERFAREYARAFRALGMNHIRFHIESECWHGTREERDRHWFLLAELKKQGCYLNISLYDHQGSARSDSHPRRIGLLLLTDEAKTRFRENARTILDTVNPYTGMKLKDDPQLIGVEFSNEEEGCILWPNLKGTKVGPKEYALFDLRFREFLKKKYSDIASLNRAWKSNFTDFDAVHVPRYLLSECAKDSPRSRDFIECCTRLQMAMMEFCTQVVRELGYTGLVGQFDVPVWFGDNAVRSRYSQFALGHSYWSHAIGINLYQQRDAFRGSRAATMQSSIESSILYWRNLAAAKFADRPYFVTETNHCIPNPYSYEFGLVMGAYSAFQGFRALLPHSYPVFLEPKRLEPFAIGSNPVARASNILLYSLFMRGDVTPSRHNVSLEVAPELLRYFQPVSPEQTKLALMTGFSLSFPGTERPEGVRRDVPVTLALPATRTDGLYKPELDDAIGAGSGRDRKFSAAEFTRTLRKKGVLPPGNLSDPQRGVYQSDTGELTLYAPQKKLEVRTPRTQGACLTAGDSAKLGDFTIESTSTDGCIALTSLDGKPLSSSRKMLLVFSTYPANRNGKISYTGGFWHGWQNGDPVPMLRSGKFRATLKHPQADRFKLHALALDGTRREEIPLRSENGTILFDIDTEKQPEISVCFELTAE